MGFALTPGEAPLHFSRSKNVMHVVSFSIPTILMRVDAILSKSQTKQESKRYNGCENA